MKIARTFFQTQHSYYTTIVMKINAKQTDGKTISLFKHSSHALKFIQHSNILGNN